MALFKKKKPPALTEDLVQRQWDLQGRLKQLEDRFDASLDELEKRYRRAEQSEIRLERKKTSTPCDDAEAEAGSRAERAFAYTHKTNSQSD